MHETNPIEKEIRAEAERISHRHGGAPVVIIVGESKSAGINRCMTGTTMHHGETFTDLLGVIEGAKQVETYKHLLQPRAKGGMKPPPAPGG